VNVTFSQGYRPSPQRERGATQPATTQVSSDLIERAVAAARAADIAIVVGGLNHSRNQDAEGSDRRDMKLPWGQDELIRRVAEANPRTIVVIKSGAAVQMQEWIAKVPSLLQAWYPGMEGGNALARILFGDVNPSGKLPCTFPKKLADSPAHALGAYPGTDGTEKYEEGLLVGYRWFDTKNIEPQFPFGHGLSYTTFEYSNLKISGGETPTVQFDIVNTGAREGAEVAQVYVQDVQSRLPRPLKELKAFRRLVLKPGQKLAVMIPLDRRALAFYDPESSGWVAEAGEFTIHVGSSSRDIRLRGRYLLPLTSVEK
jgi:beta-glucosidase